MRGWVLESLYATCSIFSRRIDLSKGGQAIEEWAETLSASCGQLARTITRVTGHTPSTLISYEDFWWFPLANYHSGAG